MAAHGIEQQFPIDPVVTGDDDTGRQTGEPRGQPVGQLGAVDGRNVAQLRQHGGLHEGAAPVGPVVGALQV